MIKRKEYLPIHIECLIFVYLTYAICKWVNRIIKTYCWLKLRVKVKYKKKCSDYNFR